MMPDEKARSREDLAEDVAAPGGASTGRNIAAVIGAALAAAALALLLSLLWFGVAFSVLGGEVREAGQRAGVIGFTMAALFGGLGALFAGFGARTPDGERDVAALILGIVLGTPALVAMVASLGTMLDALTRGVGQGGVLAGLLYLGVLAFAGDRLFKKR